MLDAATARILVSGQLFPKFREERKTLDLIDRWFRWDHDSPHRPRHSTHEYKQLAERAQTPWLGLVVTSVAQELYVEGYRAANDKQNATAWEAWQANGMDGRQMAVHRAALAYGLAYTTVLPGTDQVTGDSMPVIRGHSPRRMMAFYEDVVDDVWPEYALRCDPMKVNGNPGYRIRLYDDQLVHTLTSSSSGDAISYVGSAAHELGICPVVRYANNLDLEGRAPGEVEPFIPVAARIDQTTFDRLVVQRFASWVVRTIAGMAEPESDSAAKQKKLELLVDSILVAEDPDTKFGSLPASDLKGFIDAKEADVRDLAAVTQTPPHHLLGQMANLSAEALAAAEASLSRKVIERQHSFGESHEQTLRLSAHVMGDAEGARDMAAQVRWRDMESRSLAQTADALGKIAQMLGVPVEMLWEKIPGWTDQDVERAKTLAQQSGGLNQLVQELLNGATPPAPTGATA